MKKQLLSIIAAGFLFGSVQQANAQTGAALNFTGAEAVAVNETGNTLDNLGLGNFTMEAWVNMADPTGGSSDNINSIFRKSGDYNLYLNNGVLAAEVWTGGMTSSNWLQINGTTTLPTGTWVHVAFTWNTGTQVGSFYINGVAEITTSTPGNISATESLQIGKSAGFQQGFIGNIDEAKIWNIERPQAAIQNSMNCPIASNSTGLVLYYNFNQGIPNAINTSVTTVTDATSNTNNGTLNNFVLNGSTSNFVNDVPLSVQISTGLTAKSMTVCAGVADTLIASASGGTSPYVYTWKPSGVVSVTGDTNVITPSFTTTTGIKNWRVTAVDVNGCTSMQDTVKVLVNAAPKGNITATSTTLCAGTPDLLTSGVTGGSAPYTYTWSPAGVQSVTHDSTTITPSATSTVTGVKNWTVLIKDANGCTSIKDTIKVLVNALPVANIIAKSMTLCAGVPDTLISGVTGGLAPYSYTWTPTGVQTSTHDTTVITPSFTTTAGLKKWTVLIADANGCTSIKDTVKVQVNASPVASIIAKSMTLCAGVPDTLIAGVAGGVAPYSYTWTPAGAQTSTHDTTVITPSFTTTTGIKNWTVVVGDANNCASSKDTVKVQVNGLPTVKISGQTAGSLTVCSGTTGTLTATGASTYTWTPGNLHSTTISGPLTTPVNFTLTGTNVNGCVNHATFNVGINALPVANITAKSMTVCAGVPDTLIAGVTGGLAPYSYTWTPAGVQTSTHDTTVITPSFTTTTGLKNWTVLVGDANNCTSIKDTVKVQVNALPVANIIAKSMTLCAGTPDTLISGVTGGLAPYSYTWTPAGVQTSTHDTTVITPSFTATTSLKNWTVLIKDVNNCTSIKDTVKVQVNALPVVTVNSATICAGGTATLTANAANTYTWNTSDMTASISPSPTVNPTNYTVTGTDANGCMGSAVSTVNVNDLPTIDITASSNTICTGATSTLTASGATSYVWSNTAETTPSIVASPSLTTQYTVTGTDGNGCMNTDTLSVSVITCGTGVNQVSSSQLSLYPNPTNGNFTIETTSEKTIYMFDVNGKMVLSQVINGKTTIDASSLAVGVYNLSIVSNEGVINKRLIVTK